jgi:type IV secretory pathway VirB6-like protein
MSQIEDAINLIFSKSIEKAKAKLYLILVKYLIPIFISIELFLILILIIFSLFTKDSNLDNEVNKIDADDLGKGLTLSLPVNMTKPIKGINGSSTQAWHDTGLLLVSNNNSKGVGVTLSVGNAWYPLGKSPNKNHECQLEACTISDDPRCKILKNSSVEVVSSIASNKYCKLSNGKGIYLLFAKPFDNGNYNNPNSSYSSAAYPSNSMGFYTSHLGEFQVKEGNIFVNKAWSCDGISGSCKAIEMEKILGSRIYVKLLDDFYGDNFTKNKNNIIRVNLKHGIYKPNFIQAVISSLEATMDLVSFNLKNSFLSSLQGLISVTLVLYLIFNGFGFALGTINLSHTEFIVRIFKLSLVVMLTSPNDFITDFFISSFKILGETTASLIAGLLPDLSGLQGYGKLGGISYLLPYEDLVNQLISYPIHVKILSLSLTKEFYLIPFLYMIIVLLLLVILKSLMLFIIAYMQLAVLVIILPIMALTILFQFTGELFQNWLKYMANSAMLITVTVLSTGLILNMIYEGLGDLLNYQVELSWLVWSPVGDQAAKALTMDKIFFLLLKALICSTIIESIPSLVDGFTNAQFSPSAGSFRSLEQGITGLGGEIWDFIRKNNATYGIGRFLDQAYKKDGKYSKDKEGKQFLDQFQVGRKAFNDMTSRSQELLHKVENLASDHQSPIFAQNTAAQLQRDKDLMADEIKLGQYENILAAKALPYIQGHVHSVEVMQNGQKFIIRAEDLTGDEVIINDLNYRVEDIYDAIARQNSQLGDLVISSTQYQSLNDPTQAVAVCPDQQTKAYLDLQRQLKGIKSKI